MFADSSTGIRQCWEGERQKMRIITSQKNGIAPVTIFRIEGDIATESSEELQQQASDAFEAGARNLLLDLSKVNFISSSGLRAIQSNAQCSPGPHAGGLRPLSGDTFRPEPGDFFFLAARPLRNHP
jgi:hypothetical protein